MSNTDTAGAPDATSPEYRAGWAAEDASQVAGPADELTLFASRLTNWMNSQPDITGAEVIMDTGPGDRRNSADIILGLELAGAGGVSMAMNITP